MKKIIAGLVGTAAVIAVTAGIAYAVFTATATVNNVAFTTGNAGLQFSDHQGGTYHSDYTFSQFVFQNVFPGFDQTKTVWFKNTSSAAIRINVAANLASATGDWGTLANVARVTINGVDGSLQDWNNGTSNINLALDQNQEWGVAVRFYIPSSAGNEIANKEVHTNWVFTGTQQ
jgi:hypothetical protein